MDGAGTQPCAGGAAHDCGANRAGRGGGDGGEPWSCDSPSDADAVLADAPACFWRFESADEDAGAYTTPEITG